MNGGFPHYNLILCGKLTGEMGLTSKHHTYSTGCKERFLFPLLKKRRQPDRCMYTSVNRIRTCCAGMPGIVGKKTDYACLKRNL
jgi:hypothetical protein